MSDKEKIIAEATEKAQAEAKKQKLNAAQTKLFVEEAVKKATEGIETVKNDVKETEKAEAVKNNNTKEQTKVNKATEVTKVKYIVHTPVPNFVGIVAGVHFAYGKAEVKSGWVLDWFREHGYRVEEVSE